MNKPGRNDPCHCGSGKKYKKCCLTLDQAMRSRATVADLGDPFIMEIKPDLEEEIDALLQAVDQGAGRAIEPKLMELLDEYPDYHVTQYAMGVFRARVMNDAAGAIPFFETAVNIFPPFAEAHFNLGAAATLTGDVSKAVTAFRAAARCSRKDDGIKGMALDELQSLEAIVTRNSPFRNLDAYVANARLFEQAFDSLTAGQYKVAVELFKRVLAENPAHVQSYGNLGLAYAGLGQRSDALACFGRALELDPGYEPAMINRASVARLQDGEPFRRDGLMEVNFYRDRVR